MNHVSQDTEESKIVTLVDKNGKTHVISKQESEELRDDDIYCQRNQAIEIAYN